MRITVTQLTTALRSRPFDFWQAAYSEYVYSSGPSDEGYFDVDFGSFSLEVEPYDAGLSGSDIWVVVKAGNQYFKKEGYFSSHWDTDWDGPVYEVSPREVTVTVFDPKE